MMHSANALEVLVEAKAVAKSLEINYFYLDIPAYENISLAKTSRLLHSLQRLEAVLRAYLALTPEERASIENEMPFMVSA